MKRLAFALCAVLPLSAFSNPALPLPGEYRIDREAISRMSAGAVTVERLVKIDGDTGRHTTFGRESSSAPWTQQQTVPGAGPERHCVPPGSTVPPMARAAAATSGCKTTVRQLDQNTTSINAVCKGLTVDDRWQRIDDRTWELTSRPKLTGSPGDQVDAYRSGLGAVAAMPGMSPAQRAELAAAQAAMPDRAQIDASMKEVVAELEREARSKDPEEAAAARQQLAAMRQQATGGAPAGFDEIKERWRRIADTCKAR